MTDPTPPALTEWRALPGYEHAYQVSADGHIRRLNVPDSAGRPRRGRVLRPSDDGNGYPVVSVCRDAKSRQMLLHRAVAAAFFGPRPDGMVVNHINGIKTDNRVENLEYVTSAENERHAVRTGLKVSGERHPMAKLSAADVIEMRKIRSETGRTYRDIGRQFGVEETAVSRAIRGIKWARMR